MAAPQTRFLSGWGFQQVNIFFIELKTETRLSHVHFMLKNAKIYQVLRNGDFLIDFTLFALPLFLYLRHGFHSEYEGVKANRVKDQLYTGG